MVNLMRFYSRALFALLVAALVLSGCAVDRVNRADYSIEMSSNAIVPYIENARIWADDPKITDGGLWSPSVLKDKNVPVSMLTLSGGGAEGAFGAGFLKGWSQTGTRPHFSVVSGTSAGALLAPFAFLGPRYDPVLSQIFTQERTSKLVRVAGLSAIFGESVFSAEPLENIVAHYVTPHSCKRLPPSMLRADGFTSSPPILIHSAQRFGTWGPSPQPRRQQR